MLKTIINERLKLLGKTKADLAEAIGEYPTQISNVLNEQNTSSSLTPDKMDACFSYLSINLDVYHTRNEMFWSAAEKLFENKKSIEEVAEWNKSQMADETGFPNINGLVEPDVNEFAEMHKCGLVDMEGTFPVFKAHVLQCMKILQIGNGKTTPKTVSSAFRALGAEIGMKDIGNRIQELAVNNPKTAFTILGIIGASALLPVLSVAATLLTKDNKK